MTSDKDTLDMGFDMASHIGDEVTEYVEDKGIPLECPICGVDTKKNGEPFPSWKSLRSHMTRSHKNKVKGKMLTEDDVLNWNPSSFEPEEDHTPTPQPMVSRTIPPPVKDVFKEFAQYLLRYGVEGSDTDRIVDNMKVSNKTPLNMDDVYEALSYARMNKPDKKMFIESWANRLSLSIPEYIAREVWNDDSQFSRRTGRRPFGQRSSFDEMTERERIRGDERRMAQLEEENKTTKRELANAPSIRELMDLQMQMLQLQRDSDKELRERDRQHDLEIRRMEADAHQREIESMRREMDTKAKMDENLQMMSFGKDWASQATEKMLNIATKLSEPSSAGQAPNLTQRPTREDNVQVADLMTELGMEDYVR